VLQLDPARPALEFERRWYRWGDLAAAAEAAFAMEGARVGVLVRNRPEHVGLLVGLLNAGACTVVINPDRGPERVQAEIAALRLPAIAGAPGDIADLAGSGDSGALITATDLGAPLDVKGTQWPPDEKAQSPRVAVEMLTSGTTGPPKRIPLTYETLSRVLTGAKHYESNRDPEPRLRSGMAVVNSPLVHLSGLFRMLQCVSDGRSFCLLSRFRIDEWTDAVRRHRPQTVSLVPAALRMVLEADIDPADLVSIRSVVCGTAPLDPADADAFFDRYGIPVLVSYAATEFGGGVAGWNLADHERYWAAKRGSVGRAHPGCDLRVVDPVTGNVLPAGAGGLLEVRAPQLGDDAGWVRTTDLARLDEDGFLWILGRSDQTIVRGGFKVQPEAVKSALERDPRVRTAVVIGRDDARLGAVPVAAIELRDPASRVTAGELLAEASRALARYELPSEIRFVDVLPRTPSGKVDLAGVQALFDNGGGGDG
jgi:acyl-CoA synthetase (AMP-forming)/AMP-acid ligase II